jgi:putative ABC transport system ATP-binding protein
MISVSNLSKTYRIGKVEVRALVDVSITIESGDIICVMGKSGSGKSTLLRQMGLIDRPTSGEIMFDGEDVTRLSDGARARMRLTYLGYIFQEYALLGELTALENVYLPGMMLGRKGAENKKRAERLLEMVGLAERVNHKPKELSGGEQQRVAIARALINSPRVLFADEPCANLDSTSSEVVMNTLLRLNKDLGITTVFVSHDADDKRYANTLVFLKDGRLSSHLT